MIPVDDALKIILESAHVLTPRRIPIDESVGFVLDENIVSNENVPSFDNSAMDGYAVRADDLHNATPETPVFLDIVDIIRAGSVSTKKLKAGQAMQIMTGAPMPDGADAVVMVEQTEKADGNKVKILSVVHKGEHCRPAGNDIQTGQTVFQRGRWVTPYDIGVLASIGKPKVNIIPKPKIAILSTGDELIGITDPMSPGKIRSSNNFALRALAKKFGSEVIDLGIAKDTPGDTQEKLEQAFTADIILTSGGVSMGEFDYVRAALERIGVDIKFWKVKQKPGKPLVFGVQKNKLYFGLPGNPVSSLVCFQLFVIPAMKKMSGFSDTSLCRIEARAAEFIPKKAGLRYFLRGIIKKKNGLWYVSTTGDQGSSVMSSLSFANCLIDIPEEKGNIASGDIVTIIPLDLDSIYDVIGR